MIKNFEKRGSMHYGSFGTKKATVCCPYCNLLPRAYLLYSTLSCPATEAQGSLCMAVSAELKHKERASGKESLKFFP